MAGLRAKSSAFEHPKAPHHDVLLGRHFTSAVQIVLPRAADCGTTGEREFVDVAGALENTTCDASTSDRDGDGTSGFYVARLSLADLLEPGFLETHVRGGAACTQKTKLYALCADGRIETDDVACVTPAGQLCLSLTPRAYTRLGISGISSDDGTPKRRCLVNLAKKNFQPGNPFRDRLIGNAARVSKTDTALAVKRKYLVMHTSGGDDTLTPVSSPEGCEVTAHCLKYKRSVVATSDAPGAPVSFFSKKKSGSNDDDDDAYASPTENAAESLSLFHEWLGKLSSVGNSGTQTSPPCVCGGEKDVSDRDDPSFVEKHRWSGFMNPNQTRSALSFCRALVKDGKELSQSPRSAD